MAAGVAQGPAGLRYHNRDFPETGPCSLGCHWLTTAMQRRVQFPHPPYHPLILIMPLPAFLEGSLTQPRGWGQYWEGHSTDEETEARAGKSLSRITKAGR